MTGSMMVTYPEVIKLIVTHEGDTLTKSKYLDELDTFDKVIKEINDFRQNKKFKLIETTILPELLQFEVQPNGIPKDCLLPCVHEFEKSVLLFNSVDYYIYSIRSGHQSHTQSSEMSLIPLRWPYLNRISTILTASYPNVYFAPTHHNNDDVVFNYFQSVGDWDFHFLKYLLETYYIKKCPEGSNFDANSYELVLKFFGKFAGFNYAQPYIIRRKKESLGLT